MLLAGSQIEVAAERQEMSKMVVPSGDGDGDDAEKGGRAELGRSASGVSIEMSPTAAAGGGSSHRVSPSPDSHDNNNAQQFR